MNRFSCDVLNFLALLWRERIEVRVAIFGFALTLALSRCRLGRNTENRINVILSPAKNLAFPARDPSAIASG